MNRRQILGRLLSLIQPLWKIMAASVAARILNQLAGIALVGVGVWGIGQATVQGGGLLWPLLGVLAGIGMFKGLFRYLEQFSGHYVAFRLLGLLRNQFYARIEPLIPGGLPGLRSGDAVSRVVSDVDKVEPFYAHTVAPAVSAVVVPVATLLFLFSVHPALGWTLLPFVILLGLAVPSTALLVRRDGSAASRTAAGEVNAHLTDSFQGLRDVLAFGYGERRRAEIRELGRRLERRERKQQARKALQNGVDAALLAGALVALLAVGVSLVHRGVIGPLTLAVAVAVGGLGLEPVTGLTRVLTELQTALASAGRLFRMMDRQPAVREPGDPVRPEALTPSLRFRNVTFWYPDTKGNGTSRPVLQNLSFSLEPGETVGLVGASGAGKSTVVNLLLRFWDPPDGEILLGGYDLRALSLGTVRDQVGLVSQQTHIFDTTIRENLLLGNPSASDRMLREAVDRANLADFIASLPQGLETKTGELGTRLSGGQRQRIAIGRAFLKDAPLLVLDEATSNLDAGNERMIRETLSRLMPDRTTLIIAHRLSTVIDADRILVLAGGRIAEQGTHEQLLRKNGEYARLFARQQDELDDAVISASVA